jgi:hypothetical protein
VTTIHDFSNGGFKATSGGTDRLSFAAFAAARAHRRDAEAKRMADLREKYATLIKAMEEEHVERARDVFMDTTLSRADRRDLMRHHRESMKRDCEAIRRERDEQVTVQHPESKLARWLHDRNVRINERADYKHILKTQYDDRGAAPDAVLLAIPECRRHRQNAMTVYTGRERGRDVELFRVLPDTREVVMRSKSDQALEAAIVKAAHDCGEPLVFESKDPVFIERCTRIASLYGFAIAEQANGPDETLSPQGATASTPPPAPGAGTRPASEQSQTATVPLKAPAVTPDAHPALLEHLAEVEDIEAESVFTIDPSSKFAIEGSLLGAEPHPDHPDYEVAAIQTANGATLLAVPKARLESIAVGTKLRLRGIDGDWAVEDRTPRPTVEGADAPAQPSPDQRPNRGR